MSAESMIATHSDKVLARIDEFFRGYKPTFQDREWTPSICTVANMDTTTEIIDATKEEAEP